MALFTWLWSWLTFLGQTIVPLFAKTPWRGVLGVLRWFIHFLFVALILVALGYLNYRFDLEKVLRSPWPVLHKIWLPFLFFLLYILCWLGYWLYLLLGPERLPASFPEIDAAWSEAMMALNQASIDISRVPVFLVLGRPASGEESFFQAGHLHLAVQATPHRPGVPLRVYANRDAVFLTCTESSLLGHQANLFAEHADKEASRARLHAGNGEQGNAVQDLLAQAQKEGRGPNELTDEEKLRISALVAEEHQRRPLPATTTPPAPLLKNKAVIENLQARLQHLCRLLARERRPYCPLNGIFVLVPLAATRGDLEASQVASLSRLDLEAAREVLQVECPLALVLCDLERAHGFRDLLESLPPGQRLQALGQRFPLVPDVDPHEVPQLLDRGLDSFCQGRIPATITSLFRLDANLTVDSLGKVSGMLRRNLQLFQLLVQLRDTRKRLARIAQRGLILEPEAPPMVAGVYLAGTGLDARDQAFVAGIFEDMQERQNFVAWTPQAFAAETGFRRMTRLGYLTLLMIVLLVSGTAYMFLWRGA